MKIYKNGTLVSEYIASYGNRKIVIAIDSSKSNTAIAVSDEFGNFLDDYEIDGSGSDVDVYDLCAFTRRQIKELFRGAEILFVGIEDIITKKEKGYKGLEIHQSRYKITAVFDNFMFLFEEYFGVRPNRINNWDWKVGILPEEYRKRSHDKGSKDWFNDLGNRWAGRKDDVTDVVCILMFINKTKNIKVTYEVKETVPTQVDHSVSIMPITVPITEDIKEFVITNKDTLEHNIETIAARLNVGKLGVVKVKVEDIPIDWLYSERLKFSAQYKFSRNEKEVLLVIERK